jgi:hypothetical protein
VLEDMVEEVKYVSLAMILEGHWPCMFHSHTSNNISIDLLKARMRDIRVVLLTDLSLQASTEL